MQREKWKTGRRVSRDTGVSRKSRTRMTRRKGGLNRVSVV